MQLPFINHQQRIMDIFTELGISYLCYIITRLTSGAFTLYHYCGLLEKRKIQIKQQSNTVVRHYIMYAIRQKRSEIWSQIFKEQYN